MSMRRKKPGLVLSWQKSVSILAAWRKGKGDRDAVLDSEVVLTKMKLFSSFPEKLLASCDSASTISTDASLSEQDISHLTKAPEVNSPLDDKSGQPRTEASSEYLPEVFSDSQLPRLYKFESEDSGVDLSSGADSPSTPTGSEQSFVVHSRESSCDSCNVNSDSSVLPDKLARRAQSPEAKQEDCSVDNGLSTQENVRIHSDQLCPSAVRKELNKDKDVDRDPCDASGSSPEVDEEVSEHIEKTRTETETTCPEDIRPGFPSLTETHKDTMGSDFEPDSMRRSATSDSLEEYMEECCRLSESQQASSNTLGSGLGYLDHICRLMEKIGQLQENNLRLQRQICGLQKDNRKTKTKEDFFHQHCSCGVASMIFQPVDKRHSRSEFLSPSGTLSDLSTIPEVTQRPHTPNRRDMRGECSTPVPLCRTGLNRRSYTEGEGRFLGDSSEGLSIPQRRSSESHTWGRVKDLMKRTKLRNPSRLGLTSASLKMSCPQLYRPDLGAEEPAGRNRNSMIVLGHQSKLDFPWAQ